MPLGIEAQSADPRLHFITSAALRPGAELARNEFVRGLERVRRKTQPSQTKRKAGPAKYQTHGVTAKLVGYECGTGMGEPGVGVKSPVV